MEFIFWFLILPILLRVAVIVAFVTANVVCLLFIIKCIRVMFSEKAVQSIIRHPILHLAWMLATVVCANFAINGYREIWHVLSR